MARRRKSRRRSPTLGRAARTVRQSLSAAVIAAGNGECVEAWRYYENARRAPASERRNIERARWDEVGDVVSRCRRS